MKKYFYVLLFTLLTCIVFSCVDIKADSGVQGFVGIVLPKSSSDYYLSVTRTRTSTADEQSYYSAGTIDKMDGKFINMKSTVCSVTNINGVEKITNIYTVTLSKDEEKEFYSQSIYEGKYKVKLSRKNSSLWKAEHSGVWTY